MRKSPGVLRSAASKPMMRDLVAETGADLDAAAMFRALEEEVTPRAEAVRRLPALARRKVKAKPLLPREVDPKLVPSAWKKAVFSNPHLPPCAVDRDAYVVCVLEQLYRALGRRAANAGRRSHRQAAAPRERPGLAHSAQRGASAESPATTPLSSAR